MTFCTFLALLRSCPYAAIGVPASALVVADAGAAELVVSAGAVDDEHAVSSAAISKIASSFDMRRSLARNAAACKLR